MSYAVLASYAVGAFLGWLAIRIAAFGRVWPVIVRTQLLLVAMFLSVAAAWRINSVAGILWPFLMAVSIGLLYVVAYATQRGANRTAHASLQAWAANANTSYFVVPIAAALGSPGGALVAVLMDRIALPLFASWTAAMRRGAPHRQRRRTSFVDQSPMIALGVGLLLHFVGPAPEWTATLTALAAPILALSGAAVFVGSVFHPSQRIDPRPGVGKYLALVALRIALFGAIAWFAPDEATRVVAVLCAFSIPAFAAPQMATLYGYTEPVVSAGSRLGWIFGAVGVAIALVITR